MNFLSIYGIIWTEKEMPIFMIFDEAEMKKLSDKQTKEMLFERQKQTLNSFLERNAISKEQYNISLNTLKEKMNL